MKPCTTRKPLANNNRARSSLLLRLICIVPACLAAAVSAVGAEVASPVYGAMTLTIKGHAGQASTALSFLGLGLTRPVLCQGNLESIQGNVVVDEQAHWTDDEFNGPNGSCYLEITSGPGAGLMSDIVGTSAANKSLTLADNLSSVLAGGETFKVRKHWTLASLFGPHNEAGLGSGSVLTADEILLYDPAAQAYTTYFYKTIGLGGTGWRSSTSASTDMAEAKLDLTRGLLIRRKQAADVKVRVLGAVKTGSTRIAVRPGLNILANVYPSDALTLGNSGLYTGDPSTGVAAGSAISADKVFLYNGSGYDTYYFKNAGLGGTGWRSTASVSADASGTVIPAGSSILVQRGQGNGPFFWLVNQPF